MEVAHSAEIITTTGLVSPQCDVVIYDRAVPRLLDMAEYRVLFSECVYGVIEVKTKLDQSQLIDACEKIRKVKTLPKTAYYPDPLRRTRTVYGQTYSYVPTAGIIFAFDSIDLATLAEHFLDWCDARPPEEWPDSVWVLEKAAVCGLTRRTGRLIRLLSPARASWFLQPWPDEDVLFPLVLQLSSSLTTAWMPPVRLMDYAGDHRLGVVMKVFNQNPIAPPVE
jgi:hypothetical protein